MTPKLSIVIPCYNSQETLEQTLQSVFDQDYELWEAIIVNDGSPDDVESIAKDWVKKDSRFKYYIKENGGLGTARNYGIQKAVGTYVLPLDSDNKVRRKYAKQAIPFLEQDSKIGVVYGDAEYFGEKNGIWKVGEFDKFKMLYHNFIDACAIIRKEVFTNLGAYDTKMPHQGHEDWEFWLRVVASEYQFYYLQEVCFDYRVTGDSMIRSFDKAMMKQNIEYVQTKHMELYKNAFFELLKKYNSIKNQDKPSLFTRIRRKLRIK